MSRYITAYILWLYSKFLYDTDKEISLETMFEFQEKYITIIYQIGTMMVDVGKIFDMDNPVLMSGTNNSY